MTVPRHLTDIRDQVLGLHELLSSEVGMCFNSVFFVGTGANYAQMIPPQLLLGSRARSFSTFLACGSGFYDLPPAQLGNKSILITASNSGSTKEILDSVELARSRGARTIAVSANAPSPYLDDSDVGLVSLKGTHISFSKLFYLYGLAVALMRVQDELSSEEEKEWIHFFNSLPEINEEWESKSQPLVKRAAAEMKELSLVYVLSAGPCYGAAFTLWLCKLMEMQWMDASLVDAGFYFHGAVETIGQRSGLVAFVGTDNSRATTERAVKFYRQHEKTPICFDMKDFEITTSSEDVRQFGTAMAAWVVVDNLARELAKARNYPLDRRRYMGIVPFP